MQNEQRSSSERAFAAHRKHFVPKPSIFGGGGHAQFQVPHTKFSLIAATMQPKPAFPRNQQRQFFFGASPRVPGGCRDLVRRREGCRSAQPAAGVAAQF
jgi:hypothetical protein